MFCLLFQVLVSELARTVYEVSGGADLVTGLRIELPAAWRNTECVLGLETSEGRVTTAAADVVVAGSHPLLGDGVAVADQFGGCGVPAKTTLVPFSILADGPSMAESRINQTLLEIIRGRYGVFPEAGLAGDAMFPANISLGLEMVRNEGCSEAARREHRGLCPVENYNPAAATKQNLLCAERPARQVILDRFAGLPAVKYTKPAVEFVFPADTERIILVVEQSPVMADKWAALLSSTFQFINSLPEGLELAIITFGSEAASVHLQPTRVVGGNREGLHYRIPRRVSADDGVAAGSACLSCGLATAAGLATNTTTLLVLGGSDSILLGGGGSKNSSTHEMRFMERAKPIIRWIVFGKASNNNTSSQQQQQQHQHQEAAGLKFSFSNKDNNLYMIDETRSSLNISSDLSQALGSSLSHNPTTKFHTESLATGVATEGSFSVEPSLSTDLWIQVLLADTTDINVFEIKSPSGQIFSFPKFDAGLVYFSLRGPRETGVWSYKIRFYGSAAAASDSRMILECWGSGGAGKINIDAWTETADEAVVKVYARLDQAGLPVLNTRVFATVAQPGEAEAAARIELVDNGRGYPDLTRGDGVYTGYFSQLAASPGYYIVTVEAVNNATATVVNTRKLEAMSSSNNNINNSTTEVGSSFPTLPSIPLESFKRFTTAPSFYLATTAEFISVAGGPARRKDTVAPARITDFRLANYFNNSLFVTLAWSAPGGDLNGGGAAFRYEVRCFTARQALSQHNFGEQGIQVHSSLVPSPAQPGQEQRCTVGVPWPEEVFYYAILALDEAGNAGQVSNIISVYVKEPVTTTTSAPTTRFLDMKDVSATLPLKSFIHSESLMYIIAGIISFILIIIVIILTVIIRRLGVCARKTTGPMHDTSTTTDTPSLPDLCHEQSYMRNSISYMAGYDLPEMLEYTLRSPTKAGAQEFINNNNNINSQHQSLDSRSYHHVVNSTKLSNSQGVHATLQDYGGGNHTSSSQDYSPRYNGSGYTSQLQRPSPQHSPSISPVNSTFTVGQSTDCSVSVSGSDHEMTGEPLQVVTPGSTLKYPAAATAKQRPDPKPRNKIPPAVPNKTVHASLV